MYRDRWRPHVVFTNALMQHTDNVVWAVGCDVIVMWLTLYVVVALSCLVRLLLATRSVMIYPLTAKLFNLNFHSFEVVSRWRDPQLQMSEKISAFIQLFCSKVAVDMRINAHFVITISNVLRTKSSNLPPIQPVTAVIQLLYKLGGIIPDLSPCFSCSMGKGMWQIILSFNYEKPSSSGIAIL